ncbi:hypothetical protein F0562_034620 [Nyssa sinensis]|uniref:FAR1 domain-containing protein n=1 Tax=Nyssa sinensis TaxID=561372 RepID=A0A5J5A8M8_9ASTE|nr:hypothetical protein F0562_034620 [Nyssa sinensis]
MNDGTGIMETSEGGELSLCEADRNQEPYEERDGSIISRGLGCRGGSETQKTDSPANPKRDRRREGCTAMILVKREKPGRWVVRKFVKDHDHPLVVSLAMRRSTYDERDKKIQELTAELRVKKRLSAAYREQLLTLMKDVEDHNEHLSTKSCPVECKSNIRNGATKENGVIT